MPHKSGIGTVSTSLNGLKGSAIIAITLISDLVKNKKASKEAAKEEIVMRLH